VAKVIKQEQLEEIKNRWLYNESGTIEEAIQDIEVLTDQLEMTQAAEIRRKLAEQTPRERLAEIREMWGVGLPWGEPGPEGMRSADVEWLLVQLEAAWITVSSLQAACDRKEAACERKDQMLKSAYDRILDPTTPSIGADLANISAEVGKR